MVVQNLNFFDKFGKNMNLDWNTDKSYWEGVIYFPEIYIFVSGGENLIEFVNKFLMIVSIIFLLKEKF